MASLSNSTEPVFTVASITSAVTAVIALGVAFGLDLSQQQQTAILGVVAVIAPLITVYARNFVIPTSKLDANGDVKAKYRQDLI
jgi:hypothetical protein